jgi:hypothetical protein
MKNLFFLIVILLWACVGCAGPQLNGEGMPNNIMYGGQGEIKYAVIIVRQYDVIEGKESRPAFEYLPIYEPIKLKDNTKELMLTVRILNTKRLEYSLFENLNILYTNEKYPMQIRRQFYDGELSSNEFSFKMPIKDVKHVAYSIEVRNQKGEQLYEIGPFNYAWAGGGVVAR